MLAYQNGKPGEQLGAHGLAHQRIIVSPIENALRVELGVVGVSDVEDVLPRDEDVIENNRGVEFVALRGKRMLRRISRDDTLAAHNRDPFRVGRADSVDDLVAFGARTKKYAEMQEISKGGRRPDG